MIFTRWLWDVLNEYDGWSFVAIFGCLTLANVSAYYTHIQLMDRSAGAYFSNVDPAQEFHLITGQTISGEDGAIDFNRKTLLFILSPKCRPCTSEISYWNELFWALRYEDVDVYGVSPRTTGLAEYMTVHSVSFPVLALDEPTTIYTYGINRMPLTLVISAGGKMEEYFISLNDSSNRERIETILGVNNR